MVFYFHTTFRCYSCTKIEKLTKVALQGQFEKQIKLKKIIFKIINVEQTENKHYIKDYQLFTKTIVLVDMINGKQVKWKRLDKTWNYLGDQDKFYQYIKDEMTAFISDAK